MFVLRRPSRVDYCIRQVTQKAWRYPTNHQIPFEVVRVQETNGRVEQGTRSLSEVLGTIDKSTHLVRLISQEPPTVRVMSHLEDKMEKLERKAEEKGRKRRGQVTTKEIRLSWVTSDADYEHKMTIGRKELEKGNTRVEILFRGAGGPSKMEMMDGMQKVSDRFKDISNEWKERELVGRGTARLFLQSTVRVIKRIPSRSELEKQARKALEKSRK